MMIDDTFEIIGVWDTFSIYHNRLKRMPEQNFQVKHATFCTVLPTEYATTKIQNQVLFLGQLQTEGQSLIIQNSNVRYIYKHQQAVMEVSRPGLGLISVSKFKDLGLKVQRSRSRSRLLTLSRPQDLKKRKNENRGNGMNKALSRR